MSKSTDVALKKEQELAVASVMDEFTGAGMEHSDQEDFALPFIQVVQKTSEVIDNRDDARPGMFYNTASGELWEEMEVIPCAYKKSMIEWVPHNEGGGFVAEHDWYDGQELGADWNDENQFRLPNGNQLSDTRSHYCLVRKAGSEDIFEPAVISFSATQLKKSKRWMSRISTKRHNGRPAPMFAFSYHFGTQKESNDKGSWAGFVIQDQGKVQDMETLQDAISLYKAFKSDELKVSEPTQA